MKKLNKKMILLLILAIALIIPACGLYKHQLQNDIYYNALPSDNFDGETFARINPRPEGNLKITPIKFFKYFFTKNEYTWTDEIPVTPSVPQPYLPIDKIKIYFINHSTLLIQIAGLNIITDPIYAQKAGLYGVGTKRYHAPGIKMADLPKIDIILISHSHYDHMDFDTIKQITKRDKSRIITLVGNDYILYKENKKYYINALKWYESINIPIDDKSLVITATPSYHWSRRSWKDQNKALWGGFIIEYNNKKIYFAGDTALHDAQIFKDMQKKYQYFDVALLPIGAYIPYDFLKYGHTSPADAVEIHKIIKSKKSIAIHWGTFQLSQERHFQPKEDLALSLIDNKLNPDEFITLAPGASINVD